jgi:hypothetical protein
MDETPATEAVRVRAFDIWQERPWASAVENWLAVERQLAGEHAPQPPAAPSGYPEPEVVREVLLAAKARLSALVGQEMKLGLDQEHGILIAERADGARAAHPVPPVPTPLYRRTDVEQVGSDEPVPEHVRVKAWLVHKVAEAVHAFHRGLEQAA